MRWRIVVLILLSLGCTKEEADNPVEERGWDLLWADEFEDAGLPDDEYWSFETGYVRNNEAQYYTDSRLENCKVEGGFLHLTALNDSFENHAITSASIETKGKVSFHYGRIEVRARMPHQAPGPWPAIWTKGDNYDQVGWPQCGEIDIMEWVGRAPTVILGSIYSKAIGATGLKEDHVIHVANQASFLTDQFHIYAIEWDSVSVSFFLDESHYGTLSRDAFGEDWEPISKTHYLKLNLAMGGEVPPLGGGGPIDYTEFPFTFLVDYVRYYQKSAK